MKTTIGVTQSGRFTPNIINIASEFFGVPAKENDKRSKTLWLTFPSKVCAREFSKAINVICIDKDEHIFQ